MIKTSKEIRKEIEKVLRGVLMVPSDKEWEVPLLSEVHSFADLYAKVKRPSYAPIRFECEEFALHFLVEQRLSSLSNFNWPLGLCLATKMLHGEKLKENHWLNIVYAREGVYFIEPQAVNRQVWKGSNGGDNVEFIFM